jgi:signal transduction histidine kinase/ActR/RegA family two-component response regulator
VSDSPLTARPRVLYVDENVLRGHSLVADLGQRGLDAQSVATTDRAIDALHERHFDLIILDPSGSSVDAPSIARAVEAIGLQPPLFVLVAAGSDFVAIDCMRGGGIHSVRAAHVVDDLAMLITSAVESRRMPTQSRAVADRERAEAERLRLEGALRDSNQRLATALAKVRQVQREITQQERLRSLGQMASGVAHDFNNDLAMIVGFTELLLKRPEDLKNVEKTRSYLQMIRSIAGDATTVVDRLREFFRQREEGEVFLPVNLNGLIEQAISLSQPKWKYPAQANKATINVETMLQEVPTIAGNAADLRESLGNLILNAVDAMPQGGTLSIATRLENTRIRLDVGDTGLGMTEEVRRRCLEPFFSTKGDGGTGLGLSTVRGTVERHGGTIEINSQPGQGTTFVIHLPIEGPEGHSEEFMTSPDVVSVPRRILVVEDEAPLRRILREYLAFDGHTIETAVNGREGLERFREAEASANERFDLVVTDLAMPEMSGDQLGLAVKAAAPGTPVILLTGFGEMMLTSGETPSGVDLIVPKPFSLASLRRAVAIVVTASAR